MRYFSYFLLVGIVNTYRSLFLAVVPAWPILSVVAAMAGKFFITGNFCLVYTYTSELYPTLMRAKGIGAASMMARVGGILAPQLGFLGKLNFLLG